jgi:hypothetical protein
MQPMLVHAFTIPGAVRFSGIGRSKLYELFAAGELTPRMAAGRVLLLRRDIEDYLDRLPPWKPPRQR